MKLSPKDWGHILFAVCCVAMFLYIKAMIKWPRYFGIEPRRKVKPPATTFKFTDPGPTVHIGMTSNEFVEMCLDMPPQREKRHTDGWPDDY